MIKNKGKGPGGRERMYSGGRRDGEVRLGIEENMREHYFRWEVEEEITIWIKGGKQGNSRRTTWRHIP